MSYQKLAKRLDDLRTTGGYRQPRTLQVRQYKSCSDQAELLNFSGNDYLGLAADRELQAAFFAEADLTQANWMTSSSSRVLTGTSPSHTEFERQIATAYDRESALVFNSGYHANSGILPALTDSEDLILSDSLIHASLIDGIRLGKATYQRFAHNDMAELEQLLREHRGNYTNVWIVTEAIFSMDGDIAPLPELIALKNQYGAYLYLDEAHAIGCRGQSGLGLAEQADLIEEVDILVGTFGKALAGYGGFAVADRVLIEAMINFARPWIFSTALPPLNISWNNFVWQRLAMFTDNRVKLSESTDLFRKGLQDAGLDLLGNSHIVPMIVSGNQRVIATTKRLEEAGILAMPIRFPTVAKGAERIRFSLSAGLPRQAVEDCVVAVKEAI